MEFNTQFSRFNKSVGKRVLNTFFKTWNWINGVECVRWGLQQLPLGHISSVTGGIHQTHPDKPDFGQHMRCWTVRYIVWGETDQMKGETDQMTQKDLGMFDIIQWAYKQSVADTDFFHRSKKTFWLCSKEWRGMDFCGSRMGQYSVKEAKEIGSMLIGYCVALLQRKRLLEQHLDSLHIHTKFDSCILG